MALGFIKKVFTFGKDKPVQAVEKPHDDVTAEDVLAEAEAVAILDTSEEAPAEATKTAATEDATPPSVPSGHLPLKGGDQPEDVASSEHQASEPHTPLAAVAEEELAAEPEPTESPVEEDLSSSSAVAADEEPTAPPTDSVEPDAAPETIDDEQDPTPSISPPVGEMSGRTEGGMPEEDAATPSAPALPKGFATADKTVQPDAPLVPPPKLSWFQRLRAGLARTSQQLSGQIAALFTKRKLDDDTLQELEDLLIQADLGVETAMRVTDTLASERYGKDVSGEDVSRIMASEITKVLSPVAKPLALDLSHKPHVILVVGVNGTGKTTTIGKLAAKLSGAGLKVMLAAGDTFRAAAIEQLKIWADRTKSGFIGTKLGADAAGLAFDAFKQAKENGSDVLIIDTAGRLQNKTELMAELEKIVRVLTKLDPDAPHTVLQTLDATTGQNAMNQVEIFKNIAGVNGLIMTKLDGTARGGILVAIAAKHKLPVYFIGVGEGVDDLEPFEAADFAEAIAGLTP
ncbi:signal recognition particle-docking protein FtsY [Rhizobium sp. NRK18]|uniref:signal recognition particle-docking protein FtsY n=1 Tax=Rhizobium sp. NRK18 TaxID=2964667 RepID=UPI0021C2E730|nr:signal recognition particle-docking protein FtsY [Rhizobium sp. NRK18]MCQ2002469.1 signal recognition particle-docking protein FtsY [Rhizobium sp. NRK18]